VRVTRDELDCSEKTLKIMGGTTIAAEKAVLSRTVLSRAVLSGAVLSRRRLLGMAFVLAAPPLIAGDTSSAAQPLLAVRGADLSSALQEEAAGKTFRDGGATAPVEQLLAERGANVMRLRVWVDPAAGGYDLTDALTLARRGHAAGLRILVDLHYSDSWADKDHQTTPAAWADQDLATLAATVRSYTRDTVKAFADQGTPAALVQTGNEIANGMLWPLGQIYDAQGNENWTGFLTLLKAGLQGAAEATSNPPRSVVHIDKGGDLGGSEYFYDHVAQGGVDFDVIALSYYPFWHGSLAGLGTQLTDLAARYDRDVLVVETSYPWQLPSSTGTQDLVTSDAQLPDADRFPPTAAGQAAYFEALRTTIAAVPGRRGLGFVDWEPAWLPASGVDPEADAYSNLTMFDASGNALPSLAAFRASS
jgi:arabinogalactan endo-1,4-beta-galactosidase